MELLRSASAGYSTGSDCQVTVSPNDSSGIVVELTGKSLILKQYGRQIRSLIDSVIREQEADNVTVTVKDNGALDCTIRARILCALARAAEEGGER